MSFGCLLFGHSVLQEQDSMQTMKAIKAVKMVIIVINWDLQILAPAKPDKLLASKIRSLGEGAYLNVGITNRSTL